MEDIFARGFANLIARLDGPLHFRFVVQPTIAVLIGIRAGLNDVRAGRPPFLWTVLRHPGARPERLRQAWRDIGKVFLMAALLDAVYQLVVERGVYVLELVITATVLALVPYVFVRGPVSRVARLASSRRGLHL